MKTDYTNCNHKKDNSFSAWTLLSHSSGGGNDYQINKNLRVCLKCGTINTSGTETIKGETNRHDESFSIDIPEAVVAIIGNCNHMCSETGYPPLLTTYSSFTAQYKELAENARAVINKHISQKVIKVANDNNIHCYRSGKVFEFSFMEDLNFVLPTDLLRLADLLLGLK